MLAGLVALAIGSTCSHGSAFQSAPPASDASDISPDAGSSPPMALVNIGPDVDVRVLCAVPAQVSIASVDELGAGVTKWSYTVTGDAAFGPSAGQTFQTSQANSPEVAFVEFIPPTDALPGSTFDAIATLHADDGSFADGTVKLHGEIGAAVVTVDKMSIDFGDVAVGGLPSIPLHFAVEPGEQVGLVPQGLVPAPFLISPQGAQFSPPFVWNVSLMATAAGDYSTTLKWGAVSNQATSCGWTNSITVHGRVVDDGGAGTPNGSDGGTDTADASDGGNDLAPDGP